MDYEVGGKDAKELRRNKEQRRRAGRSQLIKVRVIHRRALVVSRVDKRLFAPRFSVREKSGASYIFWRKAHVPNLGQGAARFSSANIQSRDGHSIHIVSRLLFVSRTHTDHRARAHRPRRNSREKSAKRRRKSGTATRTWCRARSRSARWRAWKRVRAWKKICLRASHSPSKSDDDKRRRRETSIRSRRWAISATTWRIWSTARTRWTRCRESDVWWTPWRMGTKRPRENLRLANKTCRSATPSG